MRVASPCSVGWETMTGDDRVRRCDSCELNIYNFAEMTKPEIVNLIENAEGRICGRLFLRSDGTVLTKDCPVGIRAVYKQTARLAGAALSAIFALFSVGFGQNKSNNETACKKSGTLFSTESRNLNLVEGTILDPNCEIVPNAKITLTNKNTKREYQAESDKNGYYSILLNAPGRYTYKAESEGFQSYYKNLEINTNESLQLNVTLDVRMIEFIGDIIVKDEKSRIDLKSSNNTFKITRDMMENFPR